VLPPWPLSGTKRKFNPEQRTRKEQDTHPSGTAGILREGDAAKRS